MTKDNQAHPIDAIEDQTATLRGIAHLLAMVGDSLTEKMEQADMPHDAPFMPLRIIVTEIHRVADRLDDVVAADVKRRNADNSDSGT